MFPLFKPSSSCTLLYVHLPFCTTICPFCSFAVRRDRASAHQPYINTLLQELTLSLDEENPKHLPLEAIYFGGGTPSRLTVSELEWLLREIQRRWEFSAEVEITLECNPEDVTREALQGWLGAGFNRFSIGGQSFHDPLLLKLGRVHNAAQLRSALDCFHQENVGNWNLDLMFGIPGQTMEDFSQDLEESLINDPNHLSLYGLEIHPGTPFFHDQQIREMQSERSELERELYLQALHKTASMSLIQYEVSNFAKADFQSRSNLKVWDGQPYLGLGCGAHSFDGVNRWGNVRSMRKYMESVGREEPPRDFMETPTRLQQASERLMLSLRRPEGLNILSWQEEFQIGLSLEQKNQMEKLKDQNLVSWESPILKLTTEGMLLADAITAELMPEA